MDKTMSEREAFEVLVESTHSPSFYDEYETWQAACKWQRARDAWIVESGTIGIYRGKELGLVDAILNQGSKG